MKIDSKTPSATWLATNSALNTSKDEIPNVNDLANKQIMTQKYDLLREEVFYHIWF